MLIKQPSEILLASDLVLQLNCAVKLSRKLRKILMLRSYIFCFNRSRLCPGHSNVKKFLWIVFICS